jgi:hypothetical protein
MLYLPNHLHCLPYTTLSVARLMFISSFEFPSVAICAQGLPGHCRAILASSSLL